MRPVFGMWTAASTSWTQAGNPKWLSARGFPLTREPFTVQNMDSVPNKERQRCFIWMNERLNCLALRTELFKLVTMNKVSSGSARHPEGCIDAGFNLWHKVGDETFFDVILLIVFNPEVS